MGQLINGQWTTATPDTIKQDGAFVRESAKFHHWVTEDGSPGPTGEGGFKAQKDRYHLYVAAACPWAHRCIIFRQLKHLDNIISMDVVHPHMLEHGWMFAEGHTDTIHDFEYLHQVYTHSKPDYTGRVSVPILWDKQTKKIVNNESAEIIRMFNSAFAELSPGTIDYCPSNLQRDIDTINAKIYTNINNGVYKCGFATTQAAYEAAFDALFIELDTVETRLATHRYLVGNQITEADWRLFTTLVRFDAVYVGHFKTNLKRIVDYPNLSNYLRELYQMPGISETVDFDAIKTHYYYSHAGINPYRIIPKGPIVDLTTPHNRATLTG